MTNTEAAVHIRKLLTGSWEPFTEAILKAITALEHQPEPITGLTGMTEKDKGAPSPRGNYCSICNVYDSWCEHIRPFGHYRILPVEDPDAK